ncbi:MAG: MBL fold metallo-hydrolase [Prolixibacteraceae bacterium]
MSYLSEKYAAHNEIPVCDKTTTGKRVINRMLLGTWLGVAEESGKFLHVVTAGPDGWVRKADVTDARHLKVFYIDVGQGDAALIEIGDKRMIIDGGPNTHLRNYLSGWQYSYILSSNKKIHIDHVFVTHFDTDHYAGLTNIINDERFTFGKIWHNGIARFSGKNSRPEYYDEDLGQTIILNKEKFLITTFDNLTDLSNLKSSGGLQPAFLKFTEALEKAHSQGRLGGIGKLTSTNGKWMEENINGLPFRIEILGPVTSQLEGSVYFKWFDDSSHTRNGHSLVLKLIYGKTSLLFGGDLNELSETHLLKHYGKQNPFLADVAKSCHHGSSEFSVDFLRQVRPYATVISSGDNENYSHPRADAIGSAGKYSRGDKPKVYSTELARSINSAGKILYGMINLRSDGKKIYMAQLKEKRSGANIWDSYEIK